MHRHGALGALARGGDRFLFGLARFSLHFRLRRNGAGRLGGWRAQCRYATPYGYAYCVTG
jgi:hypothetical protein